jgi:hypothetical protein
MRYEMWGVVHFYESFKMIFFSPREVNSSVYISHSTFPIPLASVFKSHTDPTTEFPTVWFVAAQWNPHALTVQITNGLRGYNIDLTCMGVTAARDGVDNDFLNNS